MWSQALLDEAATAYRLESGTTCIDLTKAFEMVCLQHVWEAGMRYGFPPVLLKLMPEPFSFARRLTYCSAISEPTQSMTAILAGAGFAKVALLLVLMGPLESLTLRYGHRGLTVCAYVDDIALHVAGAPREASSLLAASTAEIIEVLEDDLGMMVSRRDSWASSGNAKIVSAATPGLHRRVLTSMRRLGILVASKTKHLGAYFGPGAKTREGRSAQSRWTQNAARRAWVAGLGRRLGRHVFITGLRPAAHLWQLRRAPPRACEELRPGP